MAKAQANASVYKRMSANLGSPNNGTGGYRPSTGTPGGSYPRKQAISPAAASAPKAPSATSGTVANDKYPRKTAKATGPGASVPTAPSGSKIKNIGGVD